MRWFLDRCTLMRCLLAAVCILTGVCVPVCRPEDTNFLQGVCGDML